MVILANNQGSGNWPVWIWRLVATVAMGLGQFQRLLSCDPGESESVSRSVVSDSLQPHGLYPAPLTMGFSRHRDLPDPGIEPSLLHCR